LHTTTEKSLIVLGLTRESKPRPLVRQSQLRTLHQRGLLPTGNKICLQYSQAEVSTAYLFNHTKNVSLLPTGHDSRLHTTTEKSLIVLGLTRESKPRPLVRQSQLRTLHQ
ncbi:hypothetical protein SFRURICE_014439, partial [Spodoptera frugiperda]